MSDFKIHLDLYAYTFLRKFQCVQENSIDIYLIDSTVYTVYPACDIIKIGLNIKQDGE